MTDHPPADALPASDLIKLIVVAGPNGAGKSTLTQRLQHLAEFAFPANYLNQDDLVAQQTGSAVERKEKAEAIIRRQQAAWLANRESFAFETVLAGAGKLALMQLAKQRGFDVTLIFVCLEDPEQQIARVAARVQAGGHDIPTARVRDVYSRALQLLPPAVALADGTLVFDNSRPQQSHRLQVVLKGEAVETLYRPLASWVEPGLLQPLAARQAERAAFQATGGSTLQQANLVNGFYSGPILAVGEHFTFQDLGRQTVAVHERAIVRAPFAPNAVHRIQYRDGSHTIVPLVNGRGDRER